VCKLPVSVAQSDALFFAKNPSLETNKAALSCGWKQKKAKK